MQAAKHPDHFDELAEMFTFKTHWSSKGMQLLYQLTHLDEKLQKWIAAKIFEMVDERHFSLNYVPNKWSLLKLLHLVPVKLLCSVISWNCGGILYVHADNYSMEAFVKETSYMCMYGSDLSLQSSRSTLYCLYCLYHC